MENQYVQPKDLTKRKYFDILDGSLACVLFIVLQYALAIIIALVGIPNRFVYTIFSCLMQLCFAGSVMLVSKIRNVDWLEAGNYKKKIDAKTLLYVAGFVAICLLLFTDITSAFSALLQKIGYSSPLSTGKVAEYNQVTNIWEYLASIITVCIIPPLCEETLFRGAMLNSFRGTNKWLGIIASGFAFMLMHGNPDQTVYQFALGITLGYIAWETRNIWVCVLIHGVNNLIAITFEWIVSALSTGVDAGEATETAEVIGWGDIAYYAIIGVVCCIIAGFLIKKLTDKLKEHLSNEKSSALTTTADMIINQDGQTFEMQTSTQATTENEEVIELETEPKYQETPSSAKIVWTVLAYIAFSAYFLKEWIEYLIKGLSS